MFERHFTNYKKNYPCFCLKYLISYISYLISFSNSNFPHHKRADFIIILPLFSIVKGGGNASVNFIRIIWNEARVLDGIYYNR